MACKDIDGRVGAGQDATSHPARQA